MRRRFFSTYVLSAAVVVVLAALAGPLLPLQAQAQTTPTPAPRLITDTGGHTAVVRALAFSPDGKRLYSGGDDKAIRVWDWRTGRTLKRHFLPSGDGPFGRIYALAMLPDSNTLAVATDPRPHCDAATAPCPFIRLINADTGTLQHTLAGEHRGAVIALDISPDGRRLLSFDITGRGVVWDVANRWVIAHLNRHYGPVYRAKFIDGGRHVISAGLDLALRIWETETGSEIKLLPGGGGEIMRLALSADGRRVATGDANGAVVLRRLPDDLAGAHPPPIALATFPHEISALSFADNDRVIVAGFSQRGRASNAPAAIDIATGRVVARHTPGKGDSSAIAVAGPTPGLVATAGRRGPIRIWQAKSGQSQHVLRGQGATIYAVEIGAKRTWLAWGHQYRTRHHVRPGNLQWRVRLPHRAWFGLVKRTLGAAEPLQDLAGEAVVSHLQPDWRTPDGRRLVLKPRPADEGALGNATLDLLDGERLAHTLVRTPVNGFRFLSYGFVARTGHVLSGGDNGFLDLRARDGTITQRYIGQEGSIFSLAADAAYGLFVSAGDDQTVRLWNAATGEMIASVLPSVDGSYLAWTPQGYFMKTADTTMRLGWLTSAATHAMPRFVAGRDMPDLDRPDILNASITGLSAKQAVAELGGSQPTGLAERLGARTRTPVPQAAN
ncbi:MAG: hypothetical protein AAFQ45_02620 [Pseudomonadota bacterium]